MRTAVATPGALVVDSLPFSTGGTAEQARALAAEGVVCVGGYLGAITPERVGYLHAAGVAFMPVTFGTTPAQYNGAASVAQCERLGLPTGTSVWLDMEGLAVFHTEPATLMADANRWALHVERAGWMACLYVGVPQPLTSAELFSLKHTRYWHGQGEVRDRYNNFAAPDCGWCMLQRWPSLKRGGVLVDDNVLQPDALGRLPVWAIGDDWNDPDQAMSSE
jgi:hypothetical protein